MTDAASIEGQCHCGDIVIKAYGTPEVLTECNCSICQRYAALWYHDQVQKFEIGTNRESVSESKTLDDCLHGYQWGDRQLTFYRCGNCGCVTHWLPNEPKKDAMMAINARLLPRRIVEETAVRRLDGADTWQYLD